MADLEYSVDGHVATILLNRPHRKNAFTLGMMGPWVDALVAAEEDPDVRAVVLTGAGDAFCSGVDLDTYSPGEGRGPLENKRMLADRIHRVALTMDAMSKPVLAAVKGPAFGAGMDMALMADLRFAGESVRFCEAYIRLGLVPGDGGAYYLPRIVGTSEALRLLWTADVVDAAEALRLGLVTAVHPDDGLLDATYAFARRLASRSPVAVQMIKKAVRSSLRSDLPTALDLISSHMGVVASTADSREAATAFRDGRDPVFRGE